MLNRNQQIAGYAFISPWVISFLAFGVFPIGFSITLSFWRWSTTGGAIEFVGLRNYVTLLTTDPFFLRTLWNSFVIMVFGSGFQHLFAIPLALILNDKALKGRDLFKTAYFLPYLTSTISIVLVFSQLYDENYGWLNFVLVEWLGLEPVQWLTSPTAIKAAISIMINWQFIGWNTVIYLAGLQSINEDIYEAAEIDGASKLQRHLGITIPLLMPIIFFAVTLSIIGGFQIFDQPFVLLGGYTQMGGPKNSGLTSAFYLLATGFEFGRLGKASAIAWLMFIVILALNLVHKRVHDAFNSD